MDQQLFFYIRCEMPPPLQVARNKLVSVVGANPPSDIASGRIAEVRRRNMSCRCMTRTSQQEFQSIFEQGVHGRMQDVIYKI